MSDMDGYGFEDEDVISNPGDLANLDVFDPQQREKIYLPAVQSLVNALGGYEEVQSPDGTFESVYRPGDSVVAVLKDLKKLWRKDDGDDERTVGRCMAKAGLMKELISLLVECTDRGDWGRKVALLACDLIAALTWPIDVQQELKEMSDQPGVVTDYASLLRAQLEYKAMMLQTNGPLRSILALILPSLAKPRKEHKDEQIVSLGLHIIRNLLAIKDAVITGPSSGQKEELAHLQSTLIMQLHGLTYFQLILTLASCADKPDLNQFNVLVLDILHLIFRGVRAKDLIKDPGRESMDQLTKLLETERKARVRTDRKGTRHSRFGTTIQIKTQDQRLILHKQNAIRLNPSKVIDESKKKRAVKAKRVDELTQLANLAPDAVRVLQTLAKDFLKSCFNTFISSILKDIRMERSKIRPTDNIRTFYLASFFIEYLLLTRQKRLDEVKRLKAKGLIPETEEAKIMDLGVVAEMAEMNSVRWVVTRMRIAMDEMPPAWNELQASIDCFTQILLLLDALAASKQEEDVEVAEILQNKLYYNGDVLDSALQVVARYKDQSVGYLDSVIHFAYVLLRMLERYSKTKQFMFVRKRKAARRKRQALANDPDVQKAMPEEYEGEGEDEVVDRDVPSYAEHVFTFTSFEKRFAQEPVVNTLLTYLGRYHDFEDPDQMKRVVGLMHRQVVRTKAEGLYFRIGPLDLFRRILEERETLPEASSSADLIQLINYITRKFFKKIAEDPFVIVETLAPKARRWKELSSWAEDQGDEGDNDGMGGQATRIREQMSAKELEFKKSSNLSWTQQMEVVVAMLLGAGLEEWIKWIISEMEITLAARQEVVLAVDGPDGVQQDENDEDGDDEIRARNFGGPSKEAVDKFIQADLMPEAEEHKVAIKRDSHFRLMLQLLSFEHIHDELTETDQYFIPTKVLPSNLSTSLGALQQFLLNPPSMTADPKTLLQKKRKRTSRRARAQDPDDERLDRPRKKKVVETQNYKSAAFIDDSDDDEEADKRFFERERLLREEMNRAAAEAGHVMKHAKLKSKGKGIQEVDVGTQAIMDDGHASSDALGEEESDGSSSVDDEESAEVYKRAKSIRILSSEEGDE